MRWTSTFTYFNDHKSWAAALTSVIALSLMLRWRLARTSRKMVGLHHYHYHYHYHPCTNPLYCCQTRGTAMTRVFSHWAIRPAAERENFSLGFFFFFFFFQFSVLFKITFIISHGVIGLDQIVWEWKETVFLWFVQFVMTWSVWNDLFTLLWLGLFAMTCSVCGDLACFLFSLSWLGLFVMTCSLCNGLVCLQWHIQFVMTCSVCGDLVCLWWLGLFRVQFVMTWSVCNDLFCTVLWEILQFSEALPNRFLFKQQKVLKVRRKRTEIKQQRKKERRNNVTEKDGLLLGAFLLRWSKILVGHFSR